MLALETTRIQIWLEAPQDLKRYCPPDLYALWVDLEIFDTSSSITLF